VDAPATLTGRQRPSWSVLGGRFFHLITPPASSSVVFGGTVESVSILKHSPFHPCSGSALCHFGFGTNYSGLGRKVTDEARKTERIPQSWFLSQPESTAHLARSSAWPASHLIRSNSEVDLTSYSPKASLSVAQQLPVDPSTFVSTLIPARLREVRDWRVQKKSISAGRLIRPPPSGDSPAFTSCIVQQG
jgi:hypothetical protein